VTDRLPPPAASQAEAELPRPGSGIKRGTNTHNRTAGPAGPGVDDVVIDALADCAQDVPQLGWDLGWRALRTDRRKASSEMEEAFHTRGLRGQNSVGTSW
jgi:hypothetical protein